MCWKAFARSSGPDAVYPYGGWDDPLSAGFRIRDLPATFSVVITGRLPEQHYSIQIESWPPALDYVCSAIVSLYGFLDVVSRSPARKTSGP